MAWVHRSTSGAALTVVRWSGQPPVLIPSLTVTVTIVRCHVCSLCQEAVEGEREGGNRAERKWERRREERGGGE